MSQTPPPPPPLPPPVNAEQSVEAYMARVEKQRRRNRWIWPVVAVAGVLVVGGMVGSALDDRDVDDEPEGRMTLVEAACQMLNDGDHPEFVYTVTKDLAADHSFTFGEDEALAARLAVESAQAQGCG